MSGPSSQTFGNGNKRASLLPKFLTLKPHAWRALFTKATEALKLNDLHFRPYSLRRGGATFWFNQHGSFDKLLVQGRWAAARTARVYLNDGLAQLADMSLSNSVLIPYVNLYRRSPNLEPGPPQGGSRSGGRGAKARKGRKVELFALFLSCARRFLGVEKSEKPPIEAGVSPGRVSLSIGA